MRSPIDDLEYITQRMAHCLLSGPSRHVFRNYVQIDYIAQDIRTQYGVTDGV